MCRKDFYFDSDKVPEADSCEDGNVASGSTTRRDVIDQLKD
jgi:hypothetical protein